MNSGSIILIVAAILNLGLASAIAGPCSGEIAAFERSVRAAATSPAAGITAPQTNAAQLHHQPTPSTVTQAQDSAQTTFESALARAKEFEEQGARAECMKALDDAKTMFALK
jgi:hypothetical protein